MSLSGDQCRQAVDCPGVIAIYGKNTAVVASDTTKPVAYVTHTMKQKASKKGMVTTYKAKYLKAGVNGDDQKGTFAVKKGKTFKVKVAYSYKTKSTMQRTPGWIVAAMSRPNQGFV